MNQGNADPFVNHPPCFTNAAHLILNAIEQSLREMERDARHRRDSVPSEAIAYAIGGKGQGAGAEREDKKTGAQREAYKAPNHYYLFCTHEVPYWRPCTKCGRDKHGAARNANMVLKAVGGAAFFTK